MRNRSFDSPTNSPLQSVCFFSYFPVVKKGLDLTKDVAILFLVRLLSFASNERVPFFPDSFSFLASINKIRTKYKVLRIFCSSTSVPLAALSLYF